MKNYILTLLLTFSLSYANISGVTYFEYEDTFSLTRTYLTYTNVISKDATFKFITDVGKIDDIAYTDTDENKVELDSDDRWVAYLKKAQLDWTINSYMKLSMGMIGMNMFNVQEKTWGNRFIYKSAMDKYKFSSSADLGFGITQKMGILSASLLMTNGEGYKESNADDENKISLQLLIGEKRLDKNEGHNIGLIYSTIKDELGEKTTVSGIFAGMAMEGFVVGFDLSEKDSDTYYQKLSSIYANHRFNDKLSAFVRLDNINRNSDGHEEDVTIMGLVLSPTKGLNIAPNIYTTDINGITEETFKLNFQFKF